MFMQDPVAYSKKMVEKTGLCLSLYVIYLFICVPREKLRVGGNQLMELKEALDRCVGTMGQHITFSTQP